MYGSPSQGRLCLCCVGMHSRTQLPPLDGEPFIAKLEEAQAEGDADHVERNMRRLESVSRFLTRSTARRGR